MNLAAQPEYAESLSPIDGALLALEMGKPLAQSEFMNAQTVWFDRV